MVKKKTKLLLVIDMQNDFINGSLGTKEAGAIIDKVAAKIDTWKGSIIATQDTHYAESYLHSREGKYLPVEHCIQDSFGWQINSKIKKVLDKKYASIISKNYFASTFVIPELIKKLNVNHIEIIGLCTDVCVISNALYLKSIFPELDIAVDSNCCAGVTPETHNAALQVMKMCQIDIL